MRTNWGTVPSGAVLPFIFDTFAGSTGASITMSGLAVTDIEVFKGTSMTQRSSDAGYTLLDTDGIDIDGGRTGIHGFSIDTGDNSDAGFYTVGAYFTVIVDAVTVDSQTVRFVAGTFRMGPAEAQAGYPKVDVQYGGGTALETAADFADAVGERVPGDTADYDSIMLDQWALIRGAVGSGMPTGNDGVMPFKEEDGSTTRFTVTRSGAARSVA